MLTISVSPLSGAHCKLFFDRTTVGLKSNNVNYMSKTYIWLRREKMNKKSSSSRSCSRTWSYQAKCFFPATTWHDRTNPLRYLEKKEKRCLNLKNIIYPNYWSFLAVSGMLAWNTEKKKTFFVVKYFGFSIHSVYFFECLHDLIVLRFFVMLKNFKTCNEIKSEGKYLLKFIAVIPP